MNVTSCATETQMKQRNAFSFQLNVGVNTVLLFATLFFCFYLGWKLFRRSCFADSTTFLIYANIFNVVFHVGVYEWIQGWSLQRALSYPQEPCKILFNEYECFLLYRLNILSRLLMLFTDAAMALDGCLFLLSHSSKKFKYSPSYIAGIVLYVLAVMCSIGFCAYITSDGPNDNPLPNCMQRQGRKPEELKNQVYMYLYPIGVCLLLSVISFFSIKAIKPKTNLTVNEKLEKSLMANSTLAGLTILLIRLLVLGTYSCAISYIVDHMTEIDPVNISSLVLWFYTYTYGSLLFPLGILVTASYIAHQRKKKVASTVNNVENQQDHFGKLRNDWARVFEISHPDE